MRRTHDSDKRRGSLLSHFGVALGQMASERGGMAPRAVNRAVDRTIAMEAARDIMDARIITSPASGNMPRVLTDGAGNSRLTTGADTTARSIEGVWPEDRFELPNATWEKVIPTTLPSRWCIFDPVRHVVPATVASVMPIPTDK
eukprot:15105416-Heterocapsa_arctica.AAC.1